jgi:predicted RNase H-like HicB family nuclease
MTYNILVEENSRNSFQATVLGLPDCHVVAASREQALAKLRGALAKRLSKAEAVEIEIPQQPAEAEHPWKKFAGIFEDEPLFDEVLEEIEAHRREIDANGDAP